MESAFTLTPAQLPEVLLHLTVVRPVFLWGAPGIGKSSLVQAFAESLGLGVRHHDRHPAGGRKT